MQLTAQVTKSPASLGLNTRAGQGSDGSTLEEGQRVIVKLDSEIEDDISTVCIVVSVEPYIHERNSGEDKQRVGARHERGRSRKNAYRQHLRIVNIRQGYGSGCGRRVSGILGLTTKISFTLTLLMVN